MTLHVAPKRSPFLSFAFLLACIFVSCNGSETKSSQKTEASQAAAPATVIHLPLYNLAIEKSTIRPFLRDTNCRKFIFNVYLPQNFGDSSINLGMWPAKNRNEFLTTNPLMLRFTQPTAMELNGDVFFSTLHVRKRALRNLIDSSVNPAQNYYLLFSPFVENNYLKYKVFARQGSIPVNLADSTALTGMFKILDPSPPAHGSASDDPDPLQ